MSTQSLFVVMSLIFIVASNMDYVDAERLRAANAPQSIQIPNLPLGS